MHSEFRTDAAESEKTEGERVKSGERRESKGDAFASRVHAFEKM